MSPSEQRDVTEQGLRRLEAGALAFLDGTSEPVRVPAATARQVAPACMAAMTRMRRSVE